MYRLAWITAKWAIAGIVVAALYIHISWTVDRERQVANGYRVMTSYGTCSKTVTSILMLYTKYDTRLPCALLSKILWEFLSNVIVCLDCMEVVWHE